MKTNRWVLKFFVIIFIIQFSACSLISSRPDLNKVKTVDMLPLLQPDLHGTVIPPNIAPLNFKIKPNVQAGYALIAGQTGSPIKIAARNGSFIIPKGKWKQLLTENKGALLTFDIYTREKNGEWQHYNPVLLNVAEEEIDDYLVYRIINPAYHVWSEMGLYQRNLTNFQEKPVLTNKILENGCINCHSFHNNNPDEMMLHLRGGPGTALLIANNDTLTNINTTTTFNTSPGAYRDWHPKKELIAFSVNKVQQFFHALGETRDVYDTASDIIIYNIKNNTVSSCLDISRPDYMETYPLWSADGRYLYFCCAPQPIVAEGQDFPFDQVFYDLMRIPYNDRTGIWGELEKVLTFENTASITHPKISPDGTKILFCKCKYGNFSIYRPDSDLYVLDTTSGDTLCLPVNSDKSESYHDWSVNGRWIVFSSKRDNGVTARPYFSYYDKNGVAHKPFVLPQKNPAFYDTWMNTFNVPELVTGPIKYNPVDLKRLAFKREITLQAELDPALGKRLDTVDPSSPWQPVSSKAD